MRNLILAALSLFALVSCSSGKSNSELAHNWDRIYSMADADPLQEYTAVIYEHSQEKSAKESIDIVNACLIGPNGIDKADFAALIELDERQAAQCWMKLLDYPRYDKRFHKDDTIEFETWHDFHEHKKEYMMLFKEEPKVEFN